MMKCIAWLVLLEIVFTIPGLGYALSVEQEMTEAIESFQGLDKTKKDALIEVVNSTFEKYPVSSEDKIRTAKEHLNTYLQNHVTGTNSFTEKQYAVIVDTFTWALENYARLPEISEKQREHGSTVLDSICEGVKQFINESYTDTPEEIRQRICQEVEKEIVEYKPLVGNYFYPYLLYVSDTNVSSSKTAKIFAESQLLNDNGNKYALVRKQKSTPNIDEYTKNGFDEFFIEREEFLIRTRTIITIRTFFIMSRRAYQHYIPFPEELNIRIQALHSELATERKQLLDAHVVKPDEGILLEGVGAIDENHAISGLNTDSLTADDAYVNEASIIKEEYQPEKIDLLIGKDFNVIVRRNVFSLSEVTFIAIFLGVLAIIVLSWGVLRGLLSPKTEKV